MRIFVIAALGAAAMLGGCSTTGGYGSNYSSYGNYDYNRPDPAYNGYDAGRYYRPARRDRRLAANERIYRGQDGRYYCRRNNGTTGLLVGGAAGGVLGNIIAPGGSELLGTVLGAAGGALAGRAVDRNNGDVRCR
ncbi:glycine zipper 2TM domain-containing protein [Sphingomonas sp. Leaf17]|uniref:glycine zipper 2TM domain-containing protein n=1 Tax=Sphingomonas sp. Leaf17 TaxID=1735683 RepID=UPI000A969749|nr:glycine zipper 2TM domain-containing protein [Sphingomonas sp. Leaf17]